MENEMLELQAKQETSQQKLKRQECRVQKFEGSDAAVQKLTGHPLYQFLHWIFNTIMGATTYCVWILRTSRMIAKMGSIWIAVNLAAAKMCSTTLTNLFNLNITLHGADRRNIVCNLLSQEAISRYYNFWLRIIRERLEGYFRKWSYLTQNPIHIPEKIVNLFPKLTAIVDCYELRIKKFTKSRRSPKVLQQLQKRIHPQSVWGCGNWWKRLFYVAYLPWWYIKYCDSRSFKLFGNASG